jgi:hypothetical protein
MTATIANHHVLNPGISLYRIKFNTLSFRASIHNCQKRMIELRLILALMLGHGRPQTRVRLVILGFVELLGKVILRLKLKDCKGSNSYVTEKYRFLMFFIATSPTSILYSDIYPLSTMKSFRKLPWAMIHINAKH